ncbi:flagellar biosynthetic protein FliR [Campylobacter hyointestinalis]|uniref:Flagellar biosynthetic protein FliR n=1 Tax=Campylobacter hyointestinalis subsp. lawsonii TaxID=91353 RepID=A0AAV6EJD3_CAMHY|nr:flagellar biosynthetic protein FliR [Campylobacter hyointestinalis]KAB0614229.1 flagellar type III secretion system protein FliR [Campylobacter hyointestinalis subsp. lawsonii]QKF69975.1 flagellar export apparatus, transmembrane gate complex, FliR component [Campylobacter hyointestinalis subsp. lawsonii]RAZ27719.1 flagellar type III secretion system protein FliR [Campylobacter hyointestinalis subsp. lawsonii]
MEFVNFLGQNNVVTFFLLFVRTGALMIFFPFFSHMQIPVVVKTALAFMLTIFLFPLASLSVDVTNLQIEYLILETFAELMFGLCAGVLLMLVFGAIQLAGEQISMIMGFSMASVIDPQSGMNSPLISNILNFIVLLAFLLFDGHHIILQFIAYSLNFIPLGGFYPDENIVRYTAKGVMNLFLFGFIISFPILALSLLADLIFGMLMKTMPQFNLLVVGFPIKIAIGFVVLAAIISALVKLFTTLMMRVFNDLPGLFF